MSRKILNRFGVLNSRDGESEPAEVLLCGPSDNRKNLWWNQPVLIVEWRSPMGDDLRIEVPTAMLRVEMEKADGGV